MINSFSMALLWQFPLLQTMQQISKFYHILNIQTNHGWEKILKKKSHTCEEGGAHLRISFWHLLMNFKNKQLLKKLLKCTNKKQNNFNIYNVGFFKTIQKNTCSYHYQNLDDKTYSSWDIEQNILKLVILGHFLLFTP